MLSSLPLNRRVTAAIAAVVLAAAGLLLATRAGAAPVAAAEKLHAAYGPGTAPRGLDPGLLAVAGRRSAATTNSARPDVRPDAAGRVVVQVEGSDAAALRRAVTAAGGTVTGAVGGKVRATVPATALVGLSGAPGVRSVRPPVAARTTAVTSEGVERSGSAAWQAAATGGGGGVTIGIVDAGFAGLDAAIASGDLPAGTALAPGGNFCGDAAGDDDHGTAVAEIVHDMAPKAKLVLTCIQDEIGLSQAAAYVQGQGAKVVNMSLEFPGAGRGDGSGEAGSPADTVRRSRAAGLLWVVSAGNEGQSHFNGRVTDANGDGFVEFAGNPNQFDGFRVAERTAVLVDLRWDAWPLTRSDLDLVVMSEPRVPTGPDDPAIVAVSAFDQAGTPGGDRPTEAVVVDNSASAVPTRFFAVVVDFNITTALRYDLTIYGPVDSVDEVSPGGIGEPATSPAALAVGAACYARQEIEPFSSTGPTIDGRVKPEITGYDGVSTTTFGPSTPAGVCDNGFLGTSAAAPHVAGAAAQLLGANTALDAAELQDRLTATAVPPSQAGQQNAYGAGYLDLGPVGTPQPPAGDLFTPLDKPVRILDTRTATGGHPTPFGPGEVVRLTPPTTPDTDAVVLNITGTNTTANTFLSVFPDSFSGTSDLNLAAGETAANLVTAATARDAGRTVQIRNNGGQVNVIVDIVGTYRAAAGTSYVSRATPARILDTRTAIGGHRRALRPGETYALPVRGVAGVPAGASAAALTVTGTGVTANHTYLAVFPTTYNGTSSVNLTKGATRAGLAISGIGADGKVRILNNSGATDVVVDLAGWYLNDGTGARYVPLRQPTRYLDTRTGTGFRLGALGPAGSQAVPIAGLGTVPYDAVAIVGNLTGTGPTATTFLSAFPAGVAWPGTSTVNLPAGRTVPNAIQVRPGQLGAVTVRNNIGKTHAIFDVSGYFRPATP